MPLAAGQSLSFYEILGPLGAGGMGEVYRAKDTRLDREVAIKVLPEELAGDEERLRRFEREAKTLASLNHPNVAGIHGIDQVEDTCFIAMELVPGEDLSERLKRGPLPIEEALDVCRQIAEGLEAAHEAGIVHRDLKPANVRITPDGVVKVLDFGLAKPTGPTAGTGSGSSVTVKPDSFLITEEGLVMGTPTYMSPEQARGKPVDRRTDIWAFGCVLYECLTGQRIFGGEALADILGAITGQEPDWKFLPANTPAHVRTLLRRCLDKDPRTRLRDIGEARVLLDAPVGEPPQPTATKSVVPLVAGILLGSAVAVILLQSFFRASEPRRDDLRLSVHIEADQVQWVVNMPNLALSRDGRVLAWIGGADQRIFVRSVDSYEARSLPGTEAANAPAFSPDGKWLAFYRTGSLLKVALAGGRPVEIADYSPTSVGFRGLDWGDDGSIICSPFVRSGLMRVHESGGVLEELTTLDVEQGMRTHRWPQVVPGHPVVLFTADDTRSPDFYDDAVIVAHSLETGQERVVVEGASQARFAAGYLVFARGGNLYAQRFDPETLQTSGSPTTVLAGVETDSSSGAVQFALAVDGSLAYSPGVTRERYFQVAWRDGFGGIDPLDIPPGAYKSLQLSPDGGRLAYILSNPDSTDLWVYDFERGTTSRQTSGLDATAPIWSHDGTRIVFGSEQENASGLYSIQVDGGLPPEVIVQTEGGATLPAAFTPDGSSIITVRSEQAGAVGFDVVRVNTATGEITEQLTTPFEERCVALDSTGKWLAFDSNRSGQFEVYLTTLEPGPLLLPVSMGGGHDPRWSADGRTLYYVQIFEDQLWAVDVEFDPAPRLGVPRLALTDVYSEGGQFLNYAVAADGRILTIVDTADSEAGREIRIQPDWLREVTSD